jgi:hypothetical protein
MTEIWTRNPITGTFDPVDIPPNIGHLRMMHTTVDTNYNDLRTEVKSISCERNFGAKLNDTKWMKGHPTAKYPKCFDLSNKNVKIGGGQNGDPGYHALYLQFMKCGETDIFNKNYSAKCLDKPSIDNWFSDKGISVLIK